MTRRESTPRTRERTLALVPAAAVLAAAALVSGCTRSASGPGPGVSPSPAGASLDPARPLPSPIPDVVALVNGQPIHIGQILPIARADLIKVKVEQRDARRPAVVRQALQRYVDRELLLQEALARGIQADARALDWAYDQARREYPDEHAWSEHLAEEGFDQESFKTELRIQHTVSALLSREIGELSVSDDEVRSAYDADPSAWGVEGEKPPFDEVKDRVRDALRSQKRDEATAALLRKLRGRARIELFL